MVVRLIDESFAELSDVQQAQNNTAICWPQTGLESKNLFILF